MSPCEVSGFLLAPLKERLDITWDDPATDHKLTMLLEDGAAYLTDKIGEDADFLSAGAPRTLLMEYVRYARDSALDVFENNYRHLLIAAQDKRRLSAFVQKTESP